MDKNCLPEATCALGAAALVALGLVPVKEENNNSAPESVKPVEAITEPVKELVPGR